MEINPDKLSSKERYKLLIGSVIPRPIAFVSTVSENGVPNLAPFSFFNVVCFNPMILAFFPIRYKKGDELKDTVKNITATKEFVINVATEKLAKSVNTASGLYDYQVDEFEVSGLTKSKSVTVNPPGVLESPIRFECVLEKMISFGDDAGGSNGIFGKVKHIIIEDNLIDNFRIDENLLKPISRLAGSKYARLGEVFEIERPKV